MRHVAHAVAEAVVVLGAVLLVLSLVLNALVSSSAVSDQVGGGDVLRGAVLLLGMAALGRLDLSADVGAGVVRAGVTGHLTAAPLTVTALLVLGFAVAARSRRPTSAHEHLQASVLTGLAAGLLLALLSLVARVSQVPGVGAQVQAAVQGHAGVGPLRVLVTGGLLAGAAGWLPGVLRAARAGGSPRLDAWLLAAATASRYLLVATAVLAVVAVGVIALGDVRPHGSAQWCGVLLVLPDVALYGLGLATGSTASGSARASGSEAGLPGLSALGGDGSRSRSYGFLAGDGGPALWIGLVIALVLLVVVAVRTALQHDPRPRRPGQEWRTGVVFTGAWLVVVVLTSLSAALEVRAGASGTGLLGASGSLGGQASVRGGLSVLTAAPSAFAIGALAGAVQRAAARPVVATLPRLAGIARRLPGGLHPLWTLLVVDATARLGHRPAPALRTRARAAAGDAAGLAPLTVDRARSRLAVAGLVVLAVAAVALPTAWVLVSAFYGPGAAARSYAAALADGDADALRRAGGASSEPLLSGAALTVQRRGHPVSDVRTTMGPGSGDERVATVGYRVDGARHTVRVTVRPSAQRRWGVVRTWRASAPLPTLQVVTPQSATSVVVNGQELSGDQKSSGRALHVFPGSTTVSAQVPDPLQVRPWRAVLGGEDAPSGEAALQVSLTPTGRAEARRAVDAWLGRCAAARTLQPAGCPLSVSYAAGDAQGAVTWSYQRPADLQIEVQADGRVTATGEVAGTYSYPYAYSGYFSVPSTSTDTGSDDEQFSGTVTFSSSGAAFESSSGTSGPVT